MGEQVFAHLIAHNQRNGIVTCEVGVADGTTTAKYIDIVKNNNGKSFIVDWWCGNTTSADPTHPHGWNPADKENKKGFFVNRFKNYIEDGTMSILDGCSWEMASKIPNHSLDICFIDASHTYLGVKNDIKAFFSKVKVGGILCGHDYDYGGPLEGFTEEDFAQDCIACGHVGTVKAVNEFFKDYLVQIEDCWIVILKPEIHGFLSSKIYET